MHDVQHPVTTAFIASVVAANLIGPDDGNACWVAHLASVLKQSFSLSSLRLRELVATPRVRLARIEASLDSMYASLPKNEFGKLGHTGVLGIPYMHSAMASRDGRTFQTIKL